MRYDGGLSLAFALWSRSSVLLKLKHGAEALVDIQSAIDNGLEQVKKTPEYFKRLATAYAREFIYFQSLKNIRHDND